MILIGWNIFSSETAWPIGQEAFMQDPLWNVLISSWLDIKQSCRRQFLFLIGWYIKESSPLKPLGQMYYLTWSINVRFYIHMKLIYFFWIRLKHDSHGFLFLIGLCIKKILFWKHLGKWDIICRKHLWEVLDTVSSFHSNQTKNMAAFDANSCY